MTSRLKPSPPAAPAGAPTATPPGPPLSADARLLHLFRRAGTGDAEHPLLVLLRSYRAVPATTNDVCHD